MTLFFNIFKQIPLKTAIKGNFILLGILYSAFCILPSTAFASTNIAHSNVTSLSSGLVGYWSLDGNDMNWATGKVTDQSGNGNTGQMLSMSTSTSPVAGKIGGALKFNGSDEISETSPVDFATGTSARTITAWIKITGSTSGNVVPFVYGSCTPGGGAFGIYIDSSRVLHFWGCGDDFQTTTTLAANTWYDIAVTTKNGTSVTVWVNGTPVYTAAPSGGTLYSPSSSSYWEVGGAKNVSGSTPFYFNGIVDDARVYNRALSSQEISQLYMQGAANVAHSNTVSLSSGLVGYWPLDGNTTNWSTDTTRDVSGNGATATLTSMSTTTSPVPGKIGGALYFNGSTQYVLTSRGAPTMSKPWTLSGWVKFGASQTSGYPMPLGFYGNSTSYVGICETGGDFKVCTDAETSGQSSKTYTAGKWYYMTLEYDGTKLYLYENGVFDYSVTPSGNNWQSSTELALGDNGFSNGTYTYTFNGDVDDVRAYNRALSVQEMDQLYAQGTADVDHSNTVTLSSGLIGYWTMDGSTVNWNGKTIADVSGSGNTLTMNGFNAATTTAPVAGKIGQALKFNDSTQDLSHANISAFEFGTGNFSVSFWMDPTSPWGTGTTIGVIGQKTSDSYNGWQVYQDSGHAGLLDMRITQQNNFLTNSTIPTGKWTLATFVRQGGNTYWYINGKLDNSGTNSASISDTGSFYIGYAPTWTAYYPGALDDVRIYNRALSAQEVVQLYAMGE